MRRSCQTRQDQFGRICWLFNAFIGIVLRRFRVVSVVSKSVWHHRVKMGFGESYIRWGRPVSLCGKKLHNPGLEQSSGAATPRFVVSVLMTGLPLISVGHGFRCLRHCATIRTTFRRTGFACIVCGIVYTARTGEVARSHRLFRKNVKTASRAVWMSGKVGSK